MTALPELGKAYIFLTNHALPFICLCWCTAHTLCSFIKEWLRE
jgi:hypothetical protein